MCITLSEVRFPFHHQKPVSPQATDPTSVVSPSLGLWSDWSGTWLQYCKLDLSPPPPPPPLTEVRNLCWKDMWSTMNNSFTRAYYHQARLARRVSWKPCRGTSGTYYIYSMVEEMDQIRMFILQVEVCWGAVPRSFRLSRPTPSRGLAFETFSDLLDFFTSGLSSWVQSSTGLGI